MRRTGASLALRSASDQWHGFSYLLYCDGMPRRDFSLHSHLRFTISTRPASLETPSNVTVRISTWNLSGRDLAISRYLNGATVDETPRSVSVPLRDFVTNDNGTSYVNWAMADVERISLGNHSLRCTLPATTASQQLNCNTYFLTNIEVVDFHETSSRSDAGLYFPSPTSGNLRALAKLGSPLANGVQPLLAAGDSGALIAYTGGQEHASGWASESISIPGLDVSQLNFTGLASAGDRTTVFATAANSRGDTLPLLRNALGSWELLAAPTSCVLRAVSAFANLAWFVGNGGCVLHYDGVRLLAMPHLPSAPNPTSVLALSASNVWVGATGTVYRWDSLQWTPFSLTMLPSSLSQSTIRGMWGQDLTGQGSPPDSNFFLYGVGDNGVIIRGGRVPGGAMTWTNPNSPTASTLYAIDGTNEYQISIVGAGGLTMYKKYDGTFQLDTVSPGSDATVFQDLTAVVDNSLCLFYGQEVTSETESRRYLRFRGDNWHGGALILFCGGRSRLNFCAYDTLVFDLRLPNEPTGRAVTTPPLLKLSSWNHGSLLVDPSPFVDPAVRVGGSLPGNTWVTVSIPLTALINSSLAETEQWHFWNVEQLVIDGSYFAGCGVPSNCRAVDLAAVRVVDVISDDLEAPKLCHAKQLQIYSPNFLTKPPAFTHRRFTSVARLQRSSCTSPRPRMSVPCEYDTQVFAVGEGGVIARTEARSSVWSFEASPTQVTLRAAFVLYPTQVWAVGDSCTVVVGKAVANVFTWQLVAVPAELNCGSATLHSLDSVDGRVWIVGSHGIILRFDLQTNIWTREASGTTADLTGISASAMDAWNKWPTYAVISGHGLTALSWTGDLADPSVGEWLPLQVATLDTSLDFGFSDLYDVFVFNPADRGHVVGDHGRIFYINASHIVEQPSPTLSPLRSIDRNTAVGDYGAVVRWDWTLRWVNDTKPDKWYTFHDYDNSRLEFSGLSVKDTCAFFGEEVWVNGLTQRDPGVNESGFALRFAPDHWHTPGYDLYCGSAWRRDFTVYDQIEFYIRTDLPNGVWPTFSVGTWNHQSNWVSVADFVQGGVVDGFWRRVRIALSVLRTELWSLGDAETLSFGNMSRGCDFVDFDTFSSCQHIWVDDIRLRDIAPPIIEAVSLQSADMLLVRFNEPYDLDSARDLAHYAVLEASITGSCITDMADIEALEASGRYNLAITRPGDVGLHYRFTGFATGSTAAELEINAYVKLATPLQPGKRYVLFVQGVADESGNGLALSSAELLWNDTHHSSRFIKINQQGFLPDQPKQGYVGGWVGDLGGATFAVGSGGVIASFDDSTQAWREMASPTTEDLLSVAVLSETEAWACGAGGTVVGFDGVTWGRARTASSWAAGTLRSVSFGGLEAGWIVGDAGFAAQLQAGIWTRVATPTSNDLFSVWGGPYNDLQVDLVIIHTLDILLVI